MKIRNSFVANSSSSSFIIGCSKVPESVDEAGTIWFGKKVGSVAPDVTSYIFNKIKEFKLDFDKMLEIVSTTNLIDLWHESTCNEEIILREIFNDFWCSVRYSRGWNKDSNYEKELKKAEDIFLKKYDVKCSYDLYEKFRTEPDSKISDEGKKVNEKFIKLQNDFEKKWFDKPEVKDAFIKLVEKFIDSFNKYNTLMYGECADEDGEIGFMAEHGDHWKIVPKYRKFSHH